MIMFKLIINQTSTQFSYIAGWNKACVILIYYQSWPIVIVLALYGRDVTPDTQRQMNRDSLADNAIWVFAAALLRGPRWIIWEP